MTLYEAVYGQRPPTITTYLSGTLKVQSIDALLQGHTTTVAALKDNLHMAQNHMKQQADQHCSKRVFQKGDQVFLWLQPYKKTYLKSHGHHKLVPKFYGAYHIIKHIGSVAYKLALPKSHLKFHVSFIKKLVGQNCRFHTILPELDKEDSLWLQPEVVLNHDDH
jgi:hypothetical protein